MNNIRFLAVVEVIAMHEDQLKKFGGSTGIRDMKLLESAVATPQITFDNQFVHKDIIEMGAAYIFHLIKNHPFIDGNKRIGIIAGLVFLKRNGFDPIFTQQQLFSIGYDVANSTLSKEDLIKLLREALT